MVRVTSDEQIERYERDGFLVLPGFVDRQACDELRAAAAEIIAADQVDERPVFTTTEQERISDRRFLSSGASICCFDEADGRQVNKIGHALHDLHPVFERFSYTPELAALAGELGLVDAVALQSMYIVKGSHGGGEVGCHQDATFLYTEPSTVTGFWFALEDATVDNGCLWALPGGHRGPLRQSFRRLGGDDDGTEFVQLDRTPLPVPPEGMVPLEVDAGALVVLHGRLPHWSDVNRSEVSRHAYSLHCISAAVEYPSWNWLQRPASLPLRRLDRSVPA